ncbi:MAG: hypothetical protein ACFCUS_03530 [Rubrimonas sp.]|uniref:hypothetical protein n=1 Tax=Rubrimonas sp. TaxID=2036015 RepID=UPI002FDEBF5F
MSLLLTAIAVKKARKAAFFAGAAVGIAKFATLTALPVAFAIGAGAASRRMCDARKAPVESA